MNRVIGWRWRGSPPPVRHLLTVTAALGLLTLVVGGIMRLQVETSVDSFVPEGDRAAQVLDEVSSSFGGDPIVVLLESDRSGELLSGPQLPRLLQLEGKLAKLPDVASVYGPATVVNQIAGQTQSLLAELTGYRDGLQARAEREARENGASQSEITEAVRKATAAFDSRYGDLLARGLPGGLPTLHNERFVRTVVYDAEGQPRPHWHFMTPSANAVSILVRPRQEMNQEATEELVDRVRQTVGGAQLDTRKVTISGVPTVVAAMGSQVRQEVPLLGGIALLAVGAWFVLVRWTSWRQRLLPLFTAMTATGLTLALFGWLDHPLSLGAVAFLPVLLGVGSDFMTYLQRKVGGRIVVSVALASAASFASLAVTPIPAVQELGLTLALGIALSLAVGMFVMWGFPPNVRSTAAGGLSRPQHSGAGSVIRRPVPLRTRIVAGAIVGTLAICGWAVLPRISIEADLHSFAAGLPSVQEAEHVEDVMGSSGEIVIALSGRKTLSGDSLDWMRRVQTAVVAQHGDQLHPVLSPPTLLQFLGTDASREQMAAAMRLVPRYLTSAVVRSDQHLSVLYFGVALDDVRELLALRNDVRELLDSPPEGLEVAVTGLPMVAASGYESISSDRYLTNLAGIVIAGLVLVIGLRRRQDALCAVAAAIVATGLGLLAIWLGGISLTPITVALGSLTAATGCEFTVVLMEAVRRRDQAMKRAVFLAAAASVTGYATLAISSLTLVSTFGLLLAGAVVVATVSALFVVWLSGSALGASDRELSDSRSNRLTVGAE